MAQTVTPPLGVGHAKPQLHVPAFLYCRLQVRVGAVCQRIDPICQRDLHGERLLAEGDLQYVHPVFQDHHPMIRIPIHTAKDDVALQYINRPQYHRSIPAPQYQPLRLRCPYLLIGLVSGITLLCVTGDRHLEDLPAQFLLDHRHRFLTDLYPVLDAIHDRRKVGSFPVHENQRQPHFTPKTNTFPTILHRHPNIMDVPIRHIAAIHFPHCYLQRRIHLLQLRQLGHGLAQGSELRRGLHLLIIVNRAADDNGDPGAGDHGLVAVIKPHLTRHPPSRTDRLLCEIIDDLPIFNGTGIVQNVSVGLLAHKHCVAALFDGVWQSAVGQGDDDPPGGIALLHCQMRLRGLPVDIQRDPKHRLFQYIPSFSWLKDNTKGGIRKSPPNVM